jgi:hypothetical protein
VQAGPDPTFEPDRRDRRNADLQGSTWGEEAHYAQIRFFQPFALNRKDGVGRP